MKRTLDRSLALQLQGPEWSLAWADDWRPLLHRYRAELFWLLDLAEQASLRLPNERAAVVRVRGGVNRLINGDSPRIDMRDLKFTLALLLAALERDLGPVGTRHLRFHKQDSILAMFDIYRAFKGPKT